MGSPEEQNGQAIKLTPGEQETARGMEQSLTLAKCRVADCLKQLREAEKSLGQVEGHYLGSLRQIALDHGIAVDDPAAGRWDFSSVTMQFTKVG